MVRRGVKILAAALTVGLAAGSIGCGKVKEAVEDELGFKQLTDEEISEMKTAAEWDEENGVEVQFGFAVTEKFDGDLGANKAYDMPFLPDKLKEGADKADKTQAMLLLKKIEFNTGIKDYTRFEIVNIARVNEENQLYLGGEDIAEYIDEDKRVNKDNGQDGEYLLVKTKDPNNAFAFLSGNVTLKKQDGTTPAVGDALVFTDGAPFVTRSGSAGKYLLAMFKGQKGFVTGFHDKISTLLLAEATPKTTSTEISYAGLIPDEEKEKASGKAGNFDAGAGEKVANWADAANEKITTFFDAWELMPADLVFIEPKKDPPPPPPPAANQAPEPPTADKPADPPPPADSPVMRRPTEDEDKADTINVDLGCTGLLDDGTTSTLTTDGAKFDTFAGWRGLGDVRITAEEHVNIFGDPTSGALDTEKRYLDRTQGYCLMTTGDAQFQGSDKAATQMEPKDGKTSEMWQPLNVPATATSIQIRYTFFSQEYPDYVGSGFNDSFFVKFDESTEMLASGTLNDLAGAGVSSCTDGACGEWNAIKAEDGKLHGELWDIGKSSQATLSTGKGCLKDGKKCYHGWIAPRVICKTLKEEEKGKTLTLRMSVSDAGDHIYDSALAVDSIVFSTEACSDEGIFSGDKRSPVGE